MIRINLAPPSVLKNKFWYVPELVIIGTIYFGMSFIKDSYLDSLQKRLDDLKSKSAELSSNIDKMHPDTERFAVLTNQINALNEKLRALESITVSKIGRFLPIIILEHLQNLKPEGLWLNEIIQNTQSKTISLSGGSFDNLLVAEFISNLQETEKTKLDTHNIKSYIYFSNVKLEKVSSGAADIMEHPNKLTEDQQETLNIIGKKTQEKDDSIKTTAHKGNIFPDLDKFPSFSLTIKYEERNFDEVQPRKENL